MYGTVYLPTGEEQATNLFSWEDSFFYDHPIVTKFNLKWESLDQESH
jgi:hypothetical protein